MTGFSITLKARNPERGRYRAYCLEAAPDLFGSSLSIFYALRHLSRLLGQIGQLVL